MTRTRKIKNFAEKARSGGRKRKRVIKFHKNPLLAMLTYSVCRFLRLLLLYSSCAWAKCANIFRQSPEKNSECPRPCCTCSFLWHSFRFDCEAIQLLILCTAFSFASSSCGMWQDCAVGDKSQKVATPPPANENVAYISYFCPSLSLSVCLSATVTDSSTRRSTITSRTIKTKYNKQIFFVWQCLTWEIPCKKL